MSILLSKLEERSTRGVPHRHVLTGEGETTGCTIDAEHSGIVAPLIAAVEERSGGVEGETARIVAAGPLVRVPLQAAVGRDAEDADAVVESVADVKKLAVGRHENLRTEVATREAGRQGRNGLPRRQF